MASLSSSTVSMYLLKMPPMNDQERIFFIYKYLANEDGVLVTQDKDNLECLLISVPDNNFKLLNTLLSCMDDVIIMDHCDSLNS